MHAESEYLFFCVRRESRVIQRIVVEKLIKMSFHEFILP